MSSTSPRSSLFPYTTLFRSPFGPLSASELTDNVAMGRRKLFTREDVLNKTIPVFWKHGLAETSVQDLERATGVRKSGDRRSEEHTSELQSRGHLVCRLLLEK